MTRKHSYDYIRSIFESYNYTLVTTKYTNNKTKMEVICPKGHSYMVSFDNFNRGKRCPYCYGGGKFDISYIKDTLSSHGFELQSEYLNARDKIKVKCLQGHIFEARYDSLVNSKTGCPICSSSKSEKKLMLLLENYSFEREYRIVINDHYLYLDFYSPSLNIAIEYDGKQHFKIGCFNNYNILDLMNLKYRDSLKDTYCDKHNIKMIRIKYTQNIEDIIRENFND